MVDLVTWLNWDWLAGRWGLSRWTVKCACGDWPMVAVYKEMGCGSCCFLQEVEDEGLHIFLVMVGYFMKDNGHEHFEFVHRIVSAEDMNEGKLEYVKFGKVGLNKRVSPPHINILQRMHQWARLCM